MMTMNLKQGYKGITAVVQKGTMAVCGLKWTKSYFFLNEGVG